jgi:hypothetical protein
MTRLRGIEASGGTPGPDYEARERDKSNVSAQPSLSGDNVGCFAERCDGSVSVVLPTVRATVPVQNGKSHRYWVTVVRLAITLLLPPPNVQEGRGLAGSRSRHHQRRRCDT